MIALYFLLILINFIAAAIFIYNYLKLDIKKTEKFFLAIPLGNSIIIYFFFLLNFFKIKINKEYAISISLISVIYLICKIIAFLRSKFEIPPFKINGKILLISILMSYSYLRIMSSPINTNDALSYWSYYTKVFFYEGTIYSDALINEDRVLRAKNYPLFVSLTETYIANIFSEYDDRKLKIIFFIYYLSFFGIFYYRLRNYVSDRIAFLFTFLLFSLPAYIREETGGISSAMVDVPLALFHTSSVMYFYEFLKAKKDSFLFLSIIFISAAIFIKNEGIAIYFAMVLSLLIFGWKKTELIIRCKAFFILPLLVNIPWLYFKYFITVPIRTYKELGLHSFYDLIQIFLSFIRNWMNLANWGIIWIVLFLLFFARKNVEGDSKFLILFIILHIVFYIAALMIIPWEYPSALPSDRLSIHILPEIIYVFVLLCFNQSTSVINQLPTKGFKSNKE